MRMPVVGEQLKNTVTGKIYSVKWVGDRMIVLESGDRLNQVLSTPGNIKMFYQRVEVSGRKYPGI